MTINRRGLYKPTAHECALLLLRLIEAKEDERKKKGGRDAESKVSRLRIAEITLKRLWGRRRTAPEFVEEVAEWLSGADFTLFFAGTTYAVVRTSVVENWPRVTSKRLSADLLAVAQGAYDFSKLERLSPAPEQEEEGDEGKDQDGG
jgi:hypothetical protein